MQWMKIQCVKCRVPVLIPPATVARVASGLSFVMCDGCGDDYIKRADAVPVVAA